MDKREANILLIKIARQVMEVSLSWIIPLGLSNWRGFLSGNGGDVSFVAMTVN